MWVQCVIVGGGVGTSGVAVVKRNVASSWTFLSFDLRSRFVRDLCSECEGGREEGGGRRCGNAMKAMKY